MRLDAPDAPDAANTTEIEALHESVTFDDVPKAEDEGGVAGWIIAYVHAWKERYSIDRWKVGIQLQRIVNDNKDCYGLCESDPLTETAMLSFRDDIAPTAFWKRVIIHEVTHIWMATLDQAADQIIAQLPKPLRKLAHRIYSDAKEPLVDRLAHTMYRLALPIDEPAPAKRARRPRTGAGNEN